MPPIIKVQKDDIINTGYLIATKEGLEGVNARSIAKILNCSIQPIFSNFKTMDELKTEIIAKINETYQKYIIKGTQENGYKGMGRAYIKFAKEQPNLFKIMFMGNHKINSKNFLKDDIITSQILEYGEKATQLSKEEMKKFHFKIWVFTHGIATLIATNTCDFKEQEIDEMLKEMFHGLLNNIKEKNNESNNKSN